jgi:hypothetical protein
MTLTDIVCFLPTVVEKFWILRFCFKAVSVSAIMESCGNRWESGGGPFARGSEGESVICNAASDNRFL